MAALLLIAHGSRKAEANEEIARLAERVEHRGDGDYSAVQAAFLELAEPDICAGIDRLVERGADEIVVVPYFLARGRHVARDIPEELERAVAQHPEVRIRLAPYVGQTDAMAELVLGCAHQAEPAASRAIGSR